MDYVDLYHGGLREQPLEVRSDTIDGCGLDGVDLDGCGCDESGVAG